MLGLVRGSRAEQVMDDACRFALELYPRESLFMKCSAELLEITTALYSGADRTLDLTLHLTVG